MFAVQQVIFLSYIIYILNNWFVWNQFVLLLWEIHEVHNSLVYKNVRNFLNLVFKVCIQ